MAGREGVPAAAVLGAGLLLAWPAAWNGYPLVFADTGTYLGQAILIYLGWDRPPFYSLFIHALHWRVTLWTVPLAQGLIAAHVIALALRSLGRPGAAPLLAAAGLLAVGTGLPWLAAQVMPDVFTGLLAVVLWLLGFARARLGRAERIWLLLLAVMMIAVHLSHLPLALGLALVGGALGGLRGGVRVGFSTAGRMAAPAAVALVAMVAVNAAGHGRLAVSPFGSVFLAARLLQDGPALRTLDARCGAMGWQVCALRAQLPMPANDFLWPPDGPLRGPLGGGKAWGGEAAAIVAATLLREPGAVVVGALGNALRQFPMLGTGDGLWAWPDVPGPRPLIAAHFPPGEVAAYDASRQQAGLLQRDVSALVPLHVTLAWAALVLLPLLAWLRRREAAACALCLLVLAAAVGNATLTGGLSGVEARYQGRIAWLLVFAAVATAGAARVRLLIRHPVEWRDPA
jgi:hypothetical protein